MAAVYPAVLCCLHIIILVQTHVFDQLSSKHLRLTLRFADIPVKLWPPRHVIITRSNSTADALTITRTLLEGGRSMKLELFPNMLVIVSFRYVINHSTFIELLLLPPNSSQVKLAFSPSMIPLNLGNNSENCTVRTER